MYKKILILLLFCRSIHPLTVTEYQSIPCKKLFTDNQVSPFYCYPDRYYQIYKSFCYNKSCGASTPCMEIIVEHVKGCIFSADPEKLPQAQNSSLYKQNPTLFTENWNKYKDLINAGYEANVEIKYNPEYQFYGCYTLSSIKSGELIGLYAGEIWELQELNHILEEKYSKMHPSLCPEQIQSYRWNLPYEHPTNPAIKYVVDAFACRNITAFINHSDKPNCAGIYATDKRHWYVVYIATQDIKAGQELLADYGEEYWLQRKNEKKDLSYASTKLSENPIHQSNKLPEIDSKGTLENQKSTHTFLRVP